MAETGTGMVTGSRSKYETALLLECVRSSGLPMPVPMVHGEVPVCAGAGGRAAAPAQRGRGRTCPGNGVAGTAHLLALSPFAAANGTTCAASCYAPNKHQQLEETYRVV